MDSNQAPAIIRSLFSPQTLMKEVEDKYDIGKVNKCQLIRSLTNDVYLLKTDTKQFILKVYGLNAHPRSDILYILDLLAHLSKKGLNVPIAQSQKDGNLLGQIEAPEGTRFIVLYSFVEGQKPKSPFDKELYKKFGQAIAQIYNALGDFSSSNVHSRLDLDYYIEQSLKTILPELASRPEDGKFIIEIANTTKSKIIDLDAKGLEKGICHGDLTLDNLHLASDNSIAFYDFDSGGPGWLASDPYGIYQFDIDNKNGFWTAFLEGYEPVRPFSDLNKQAMPYFVVAQFLANLAWEFDKLRSWTGTAFVTEERLNQRLKTLREWSKTQF